MEKLRHLPDRSRVWIFTASRLLEEAEVLRLQDEGDAFVHQWAAHGKGMAAGFQVWRQRFVVLAADESITTASGCSIDDAFRFLQRIGSDSGVDLMDRKTVVYVAGNEDVAVPLSQCWAQRKAEIINDNTLVYNTLIDTLGALRSGFPCRFGDTWLAEMWK